MRVRDSLGISGRSQRYLARGMQFALFGLLFVAVERQSPNLLVTTGTGLAVTFLPGFLERDLELPMDAGLTLWITTAAFLHTVGVAGVPGTGTSLYAGVPYYDHMTHALSASVVTGVGYATVRALDEHSEGIHLPRRFMFAFLIVFVIAFGVIWELVEFGIAVLSSAAGLTSTGFTQHGLDDTLLDLVFNAIGGVVVALWGTVYLTGVSETLRERLDARSRD